MLYTQSLSGIRIHTGTSEGITQKENKEQFFMKACILKAGYNCISSYFLWSNTTKRLTWHKEYMTNCTWKKKLENTWMFSFNPTFGCLSNVIEDYLYRLYISRIKEILEEICIQSKNSQFHSPFQICWKYSANCICASTTEAKLLNTIKVYSICKLPRNTGRPSK